MNIDLNIKYLAALFIIIIGAVIGGNVKEIWKYSVGFAFGYLVASVIWKL